MENLNETVVNEMNEMNEMEVESLDKKDLAKNALLVMAGGIIFIGALHLVKNVIKPIIVKAKAKKNEKAE